jgi:hypothetical protein
VAKNEEGGKNTLLELGGDALNLKRDMTITISLKRMATPPMYMVPMNMLNPTVKDRITKQICTTRNRLCASVRM